MNTLALAAAAAFNFDGDAVGRAPDGWTCAVTGKGSPVWRVEALADAPGAAPR